MDFRYLVVISDLFGVVTPGLFSCCTGNTVGGREGTGTGALSGPSSDPRDPSCTGSWGSPSH